MAYVWADRIARSWNLDDAGRDRLAFDGFETGPTLLIEAFDAILDVSRRNGVSRTCPDERSTGR